MTLSININAPWVDVNLTWDARPWHDPEFIARQDQAITAQAAAEAAWAARFPELAADLNPLADACVFEYLGPWAVAPASPEVSLLTWLSDALATVDNDRGIHADLRVQARAVLRHRAAATMRQRDVWPTVQPMFAALQAWTTAYAARQFRNHTANKPGVLIEVAARGDHPRRTLFIGDMTPGGISGGCCAEGIDDDDVILRYRDLREFIDAARVVP